MRDWLLETVEPCLLALEMEVAREMDAELGFGSCEAGEPGANEPGCRQLREQDGSAQDQRPQSDVVASRRCRNRGSVVRNLDAWYDAFKPKETEALYLAPDKRVKIW